MITKPATNRLQALHRASLCTFKWLLSSLAALAILGSPVKANGLDESMAALNAGDFETSLSIVVPLATAGLSEAQLLLGMHYMMGMGIENNPQKGLEWYQKSAAQNNTNALALMGAIYRDGVLVEKNSTEALRLFTQSAKQGNYRAAASIALMFEEADGVGKDDLTALMWYDIAVAYGSDPILRNALADKMALSEIIKSAALAQQCINTNFGNCGAKPPVQIFELYCTLTNVQGGIAGQNDSWPRMGENTWSKITLPSPMPVEKSGQLSLGPGALISYQLTPMENIETVFSGALFVDAQLPGFDAINAINKFSQNTVRLQYRCFDQRLSFIKNVVDEP